MITANAFIYNMTTRRWTLLGLHGSQSTQSTFYGIWQESGPRSSKYTLACGSAASGHKSAFLINYDERTGKFAARITTASGMAARLSRISRASRECRAASISLP